MTATVLSVRGRKSRPRPAIFRKAMQVLLSNWGTLSPIPGGLSTLRECAPRILSGLSMVVGLGVICWR